MITAKKAVVAAAVILVPIFASHAEASVFGRQRLIEYLKAAKAAKAEEGKTIVFHETTTTVTPGSFRARISGGLAPAFANRLSKDSMNSALSGIDLVGSQEPAFPGSPAQVPPPISPETTPSAAGIDFDIELLPHEGENTFDSEMSLLWSLTPKDLNRINAFIKTGAFKGGLVPLGAIRVETSSLAIKRRIYLRPKTMVDLKWDGEWAPRIAESVGPDFVMDMGYEGKVRLGNAPVAMTGRAALSDDDGFLRGIVRSIKERICDPAKDPDVKDQAIIFSRLLFAGSDWAVFSDRSISQRSLKLTLKIEAFDRNQAPVEVNVKEDTIVFTKEGQDVMLWAFLPSNCPFIKIMRLKVAGATYHYEETGDMYAAVSCDSLSGTIKSAPGGGDIERYFDPDHDVEASRVPEITVDGNLLNTIPFHGIVREGSPPYGIAGARVEVAADDNSFRRVAYTGSDGTFNRDFYVTYDWGVRPKYTISVTKEGYPASMRNHVVELVNDRVGYVITMNRLPEHYVDVAGNVTDFFGVPLPQADVSLVGKVAARMKTNEDGKFSFNNFSRTDTISLYVYKRGYNIHPIVKSLEKDERHVGLDIRSTRQDLENEKIRGDIRVSVISTISAKPEIIEVTKMDHTRFLVTLNDESVFTIPVKDEIEELTLNCADYSLSPSTVTARFPGQALDRLEEFTVTATPPPPGLISLSPLEAKVEMGGVYFAEKRPEERTTITATVSDQNGKPMAGVPVRFETVSNEGGAALWFSDTDYPGTGYGVTESDGTASVDIAAYYIVGKVVVRAVLAESEWKRDLASNYTTITISPSRRIMSSEKPIGSIKVITKGGETTEKGVDVVRQGDEVTLELAGQPGNPAYSDLFIGGRITGYRIGISKDGGPFKSVTYDIPPEPYVTERVTDLGEYQVMFQVKEEYGGQEYWSDEIIMPFKVIPQEVAPVLFDAGTAP